MNRLIRLNKATVISLIVALIACFGPLQNARGQNPCPTNCINNNTAIGGALQAITTGRFNTGTGYVALNYNTTGNRNTATGYAALLSNTTASDNTANGAYALNKNTVGANNTAIGTGALLNNTTGNYNAASGFMALRENATGEFNTATGAGALLSNTADENTATGAAALFSNTTGGFNTAAGSATLYRNTTGAHNTANGFQTLSNNTTGSDNVALGFLAGNNQTTGSNNVYIGSNILGGAGENNACYIGSIFGQTSVNGIPVLINSSNKLGTATSSARFKRDIHDMNKTSEALFALRPVAFRYKKEIDPAGTSQLGLVAEDVEKVNPDLVVRDKEGKPYSVRYDQVNAMLLNEFLKEHRKVEQMQKQIEALTAGLQKVSAQLEVSKTSPQTVLNNQ
jgi:trimeric autotransporter adhesin